MAQHFIRLKCSASQHMTAKVLPHKSSASQALRTFMREAMLSLSSSLAALCHRAPRIPGALKARNSCPPMDPWSAQRVRTCRTLPKSSKIIAAPFFCLLPAPINPAPMPAGDLRPSRAPRPPITAEAQPLPHVDILPMQLTDGHRTGTNAMANQPTGGLQTKRSKAENRDPSTPQATRAAAEPRDAGMPPPARAVPRLDETG